MDEVFGEVVGESLPPQMPEWLGARYFGPVYQLNDRVCELLGQAAEDPQTTLPIVAENRALWLALNEEARARLARVPLVLVDAQFKDEALWKLRVAGSGAELGDSGLPTAVSEALMVETLMFAWQVARSNREVALMAFGMVPSVAKLIAELSPQQVRAVALQQRHGIQVWLAGDHEFWRELLQAVIAGDEDKIAELQLHAKLSFCNGLVKLRK